MVLYSNTNNMSIYKARLRGEQLTKQATEQVQRFRNISNMSDYKENNNKAKRTLKVKKRFNSVMSQYPTNESVLPEIQLKIAKDV